MADHVSRNPVRAVLTEATLNHGCQTLLYFRFDFNVNCHGPGLFPGWHLLCYSISGLARNIPLFKDGG